ncbi:hypothetical protein Tco_0888118 [Tanacetum coccineum]
MVTTTVRADVELKDNIVDEFPKNVDLYVVNNMKKPSQATRGVPVGPKVTLVDYEDKHLPKVNSLGDHDKTYENDDYDFDSYDDDMYEGHDISDKIQAICDNLDIRVRGRKKK